MFFKGFCSLIARLRVVDLSEILLGLLLIPPRRDHSSGLCRKFREQAVKGLDAVPHQRIVRWGIDVCLGGICSRFAEIVKSFRLDHLVDCDHHFFKRLRFDHRDVLLLDREGYRRPAIKLDEQRADTGIVLDVRQLPVDQVDQRLHLFIHCAPKDLLDGRGVFSTKTFAYNAFKVLLITNSYIPGCSDRIVSNTASSMLSAQSGFSSVSDSSFKKLHYFLLADFMLLLYIFPQKQQVER